MRIYARTPEALKNSKNARAKLQGNPKISAIKLSPNNPWDIISAAQISIYIKESPSPRRE